MSKESIHDQWCTTISQKLAFAYMQKREGVGEKAKFLSDESFPGNLRQVINLISLSLKPNQWLMISRSPFKKRGQPSAQSSDLGRKPQGLWLSKGDWPFHDVGGNWDDHLMVVEVDYTDIHVVTDQYGLDNFCRQYSYQRFGERGYNVKWSDVAENHKAFAMVPNVCPPYSEAKVKYDWLTGWDVSSLVVWDDSCIGQVCHIGKMSDYIRDTDTEDGFMAGAKLLIQKIKDTH